MLNLLLAFENLHPMNWEVIKPALHFLWKGLLAIFVVIALIIIAVKITTFAVAKSEKYKKEKAQRLNNEKEE